MNIGQAENLGQVVAAWPIGDLGLEVRRFLCGLEEREHHNIRAGREEHEHVEDAVQNGRVK